jgi:hypothetical protein
MAIVLGIGLGVVLLIVLSLMWVGWKLFASYGMLSLVFPPSPFAPIHSLRRCYILHRSCQNISS